MGMKVYLLSAVNLRCNRLSKPISNIKIRPNLNDVPATLLYDEKFFQIGNNISCLFSNNVNTCIQLVYYGESENADITFKDYKCDVPQCQAYLDAYKNTLDNLSNYLNESIEDVEWCTLIFLDPLRQGDVFTESYSILNCNIFEDNLPNDEMFLTKSVRLLVDAAFIYQLISKAKLFIESVEYSTSFSKIDHFNLVYYSKEISIVGEPNTYLTDSSEIGRMVKIFDAWQLCIQVSTVSSGLNSVTANYSFSMNCNSACLQENFNRLVALFTFVVAYGDFKNIILQILPKGVKFIMILYFCIIMVLIFKITISYLYYIYQTCSLKYYTYKFKK